MAKSITLKDNDTKEIVYPTTLVSNVYATSGMPMTSVFPDISLSNVSYPIPTAGYTTTGAADRVVERYVSSDGLTWYEKYASGWKRCGLIATISSITANTIANIDVTLPITFSNTNYHSQLTGQYGGSASGRCVWYSSGLNERTTSKIRLSCHNYYTSSVTEPKCWIFIQGY